MQKLFKIIPTFTVLLIGFLGFIKGLFFLDPDFGWHLREGQLILQNGIQRVDPFSYTMPSFPYIDHEWLSNVVMYLLHERIGVFGLALLFAFLFSLSIYLVIPRQYKNYSFIPILLASAVMLGAVGIRPQIETWVFFALVFKIILDENLWKKFKYLVPLIFLVWVNLHGGFAFGLLILLNLIFVKTIEKKSIATEEIKIFLLSLFATGFNPYGFSIWQEILRTATDSSLRLSIVEWMPSVYNPEISFVVFVALSLGIIFFYRKRFNLFELLIFFISFVMALASLRNVPFWAIISIYMLSKGLFYFNEQLKTHKENVQRFKKIKFLLVLLFLALFSYTSYQRLSNIYGLDKYPVNAVKFLQKQDLRGNIFSNYNNGGYLIWKLPYKKVYIDGRMPSWRRDIYIKGESSYAFGDYEKMLSNESFFKNELKKYNIKYILLPKINPRKNSTANKKLANLEKKFINLPPDAKLLSKDLTSLGLLKIYDDSKFVIYKR